MEVHAFMFLHKLSTYFTMRITSDLLFGSADTPAIATPSANKFTNLSCDSEMYSKILFKFFVSFVSEEEEEEDDDDDDDDEKDDDNVQ